jgi:hypothetical protein
MKTLKRRQHSGFVKYPNDFEKRIVDGTARFRTRCDMLVGPCACGGVHQEHDSWVRGLLEEYAVDIEPFELKPDENGFVKIPRYWIKPNSHLDCTMLIGPCRCGRVHSMGEDWVILLVQAHKAKLEGCERRCVSCQSLQYSHSSRLQRDEI